MNPPQGPPPSQNHQSQPKNQNPYSSPNNNPFPPQQQPFDPNMHRPPAADGFAITSMVLGIIAVLTCFIGILFGSIAVIFGHLSISRINKNPQTKGGKGMAIAGLATGYTAIALFLLIILADQEEESIYEIFQESFEEEFKEELEKQRQEQEQETRELVPDQN